MASLRAKTAIAGLGITEQGKVYGPSAVGFAVEAIRLARGRRLKGSDLDGLLVNPGMSWGDSGAMASFAVQQAMGAARPAAHRRDEPRRRDGGRDDPAGGARDRRRARERRRVLFSDAPLKPPKPKDAKGGGGSGSSGAYAFAGGLNAAYGAFGVNALYALLTQRPCTASARRTTSSARSRWRSAPGRRATRRRSSPAPAHDRAVPRVALVVEPFHLLDCCLVSNGGLAVIVTSAERARSLRQPPVYILGMGRGHPGGDPPRDADVGRAGRGEDRVRDGGAKLSDVTFCELYDCYTFTVLNTLEDYGCARAKAVRSSRADASLLAARCRSTPAADSCRRSTCGA